MTIADRVLPLNWTTATASDTTDAIPVAAIQSITMSMRFGYGKNYAIGYISKFAWTTQREKQVLHQIEAYPNGTFGGGSLNNNFASSLYWPGEPVEVVPGKLNAIEISLSRYVLYSSNLLSSLLKSDGAGTEDEFPVGNNGDLQIASGSQNPYVSLIQQTRPVFIYQQFTSPISGKVIYGRVFENCWFTDIGEEIADAKTNEAIIENGKLTCTRMRPFNII